MLPVLVGLALVVHGLIHYVGFAVPWRYATIRQIQPAAGAVSEDGSDISRRMLGLAWLAVTVAYVLVAAGIAAGAAWAPGALVVVTIVSLGLCLSRLPDMLLGALIDLVILAVAIPLLLAEGSVFD